MCFVCRYKFRRKLQSQSGIDSGVHLLQPKAALRILKRNFERGAYTLNSMKKEMARTGGLIPFITALPWKSVDTGKSIELLEKILDEIPYY